MDAQFENEDWMRRRIKAYEDQFAALGYVVSSRWRQQMRETFDPLSRTFLSTLTDPELAERCNFIYRYKIRC